MTDRDDPDADSVAARAAVVRHATRCFPWLVPEGGGTYADLPLLDADAAARAGDHAAAVAPRDARVFRSSGTSGRPKTVVWTVEDDSRYVADKRALFRPWLAGCRRGFVSLAVGHNADSAPDVLRDLGLEVYAAGLESRDRQVAALRASAPDVLYCSPSIIARLVQALGDGPRPSVRLVITNGELLVEAARDRIAAAFGPGPVQVADTYGSTEVGTIAASCPRCGAYHLLPGLVPEALPLAGFAGGTGPAVEDAVVLVLSSLRRSGFPVVRFVTYDVVAGLRRQLCGGAWRHTFDRLLGRCDDMLSLGELLSPYPLAELVARRLPAARWCVLNPGDRLAVVLEGAEPPGFRDELAALYPLHTELGELGLVPGIDVVFLPDAVVYDAFAARAGLGSGARGKEGRRVLRRRLDPAWLPPGAAVTAP
jgi:hypothetical protein